MTRDDLCFVAVMSFGTLFAIVATLVILFPGLIW